MNKKTEEKKKKILTVANSKNFGIDLIFILAAAVIGSYSTIAVMIPNGMMSGGLSGGVRLIQNFVHLNFSTIYYMVAAMILLIMWVGIGFKYVKRAVLVSIIYPSVMAVIERFDMALLESRDLILAAVFLGVFQGISTGLVFMAFVGTLFVIKPGASGMPLIPTLVGLFSGLCAGIAYTCVRKLGLQGVSGSFIVLFFSGFSCLISLSFIVMNFAPMTIIQTVILIMAGVAAAGGQFFITMAYSYAPAKEISIYDYSQIIFATALSFFVLGQIPDCLSFIGYGIIIGASVIMFIYNNKRFSN